MIPIKLELTIGKAETSAIADLSRKLTSIEVLLMNVAQRADELIAIEKGEGAEREKLIGVLREALSAANLEKEQLKADAAEVPQLRATIANLEVALAEAGEAIERIAEINNSVEESPAPVEEPPVEEVPTEEA